MNIACIYGRNEAENIPLVIESLLSQTIKFDRILYVDDCSTDKSLMILKNYPEITVWCLKGEHESYVDDPRLSHVANQYIDYVNRLKPETFMVIGADTVLNPDYLGKCLKTMREEHAVFVSGQIIGETERSKARYAYFPRGTGLLVKYDFWRENIGRYPLAFSWEMYPIYKALSLGFKTLCIKNAHMRVLRKTEFYRPSYGFGMRELGYNPFYAFARCGLAIMVRPFNGLKMTWNYIKGSKPFERELTDYVGHYQRSIFFKRLTSKLIQRYDIRPIATKVKAIIKLG